MNIELYELSVVIDDVIHTNNVLFSTAEDASTFFDLYMNDWELNSIKKIIEETSNLKKIEHKSKCIYFRKEE